MTPDHFWTSQDGQILAVKALDDRALALTLAFWPRHPGDWEFMREHIGQLRFTERSALARIGGTSRTLKTWLRQPLSRAEYVSTSPLDS